MPGLAGISNAIIPIICIIPIYLNMQYYLKTKIREYALLGIYFLGWTVMQTYFLFMWGFEVFSFSVSGYWSSLSPFLLTLSIIITETWLNLDALPLGIVHDGASMVPNLVIFQLGSEFLSFYQL